LYFVKIFLYFLYFHIVNLVIINSIKMRLWSLHPKYLDRAWLLACWREWLLAKKVLEWNTIWYKNHPQLNRFKNFSNPILAINAFLTQIYIESKNRWYVFWSNKIEYVELIWIIEVTDWQLNYEKEHLFKKLSLRDINKANLIKDLERVTSNPIFRIINWNIESWEIT